MSERPMVVLLHGLGRSKRSMSGLAKHLRQEGFDVWSHSYASRSETIQRLATSVGDAIRKEVGERPMFAVTHSLGGILVRHLRNEFAWRGVVMLAPPNQGSQLAARLSALQAFRHVFGPVGAEVGRPEDWPSPPEPFAVIAGTRRVSIGNPTSWFTNVTGLIDRHEPSDGTVTVAETRLEGMSDFRLVDASHTWIMNHPQARTWTVELLRKFGAT